MIKGTEMQEGKRLQRRRETKLMSETGLWGEKKSVEMDESETEGK